MSGGAHARMQLTGRGPAIAWDGDGFSEQLACVGDRVRVRHKKQGPVPIEGRVDYVSFDGFDLDIGVTVVGVLYSLVSGIELADGSFSGPCSPNWMGDMPL